MAVYTTIDDPEAYFQVKTYTGNGSDDHAQTFDGTTDMQPDMVWIKSRSDTGYNHCLIDSVRGVTKVIRPNLLNAEATLSDALKSFDSDGFTLDDDGSNGEMNVNTQTYIAWCWKESATAGFGIETWTGDGNTNRDVAHNMSATPNSAIIKRRDSTNSWIVYHHKNTSAPLTDYLYLDTNDATSDASGAWIGVDGTNVELVQVFSATNTNTATYVGYFWSEKQGFSKMGSYTGNGNADGPFVYTGFKPAWVMVKASSATGYWVIKDNKRTNSFNVVDGNLYPNESLAEDTGSVAYMDLLSNGFKLRGTYPAMNASGQTNIYMAFAEAPFVNSNGVPCNAR